MSTPPLTRVAAVVGLAFVAAYALGAGLAAGIPPEMARFSAQGGMLAGTVGAVLGAIASGYRDPTGGTRTTATTRIVEVGVLVVVARLSSLVGLPAGEAALRWSQWLSRPTTIVEFELVVLIGLALAAWAGVLVTLRDVVALETVARTAAAGEPLERLVRRYLLTGLAATVAVGLAGRAGAPTLGTGLAVLVFLVGGGLGIARVRLGGLLARWRDLDIAVAHEVAPRWRRSSVLLVGAAILLALLLPTPSGVGLVGVVIATVRGVGLALEAAQDLVRRISPRWADPFETDWDWGGWEPFSEGTPRGTRDLMPPGTLPGWLDPTLTVLAVAVAVLVVVVLLRMLTGDAELGAGTHRRNLLRGGPLRLLRTLRRLAAALHPGALVAWIAGLWRRAVGGDPREEVVRVGDPDGDLGGGTRRRRDPTDHRERVLAAYAEVVHLAERRGVPRRPSRTPYEFEDDLAPLLTAERGSLLRLTDRYVEARFSEHVVDERTARRAIEAAERIRRALDVPEGDAGEASDPGGTGSDPSGRPG